MDTWYNQLGFYNNPLNIKPAAYHDEILGSNGVIDEVLDKVRSGSILFIDGDYGTGKTTILRKIINEFGGKKKVVYYSCNRSENGLDVERLIKGGRGFFGELFGVEPKNMVLLLDEVQDLNKEDCEALHVSFDNKSFKSIVLVSKDFRKVNFGNGLKGLIGKNIIKMKKFNGEEAVDFIRKRIGNLKILSDEIIKSLNKKADGNPRKLLKDCEEVCKYAVENFEDEVNGEIVKKVLS
ncbi:MAG: AAA family ATPase [Candidatus Aenigmarchaeota archaeon]|nr:AAA family ATPase [Candidatus Aenigmarchaeota archaeon]